MLETKNNLKAWLYLSPVLILMGIFTFYPLFNTLLLAFKEYEFVLNAYEIGIPTFTKFGFANFAYVFADAKFRTAITNTLLIVFVSVPCSIILSLLIAVALNSIKPLKKVFQTIFFIPYVTNAIAIGMVFSVIFSRDTGLFNALLSLFNIDNVDWINSGSSQLTRMFVLQLYIVWSSLPFKILIFLSALQGVDKQYYQAAQIDHASKSTVLRRVTIPLISPIIAYLTITSFIGAFKEYSSIIGLFGTDAGPAAQRGTMGTIVWYIYQFLGKDNIPNSDGVAAAAAVILLCIILCITAVNMYISKKKVHF
ncbi:MAG: sugar ABC transporter permease [bacterium]